MPESQSTTLLNPLLPLLQTQKSRIALPPLMPRAHQGSHDRILTNFRQLLLVRFDLRGEAVEFGPVDLLPSVLTSSRSEKICELTYSVPLLQIKFAHAPTARKLSNMRKRNGHVAASGARRVRLPTRMKNMLAARMYGIDWINTGRRSAKCICAPMPESLGR
jgi:hypothetical protein